MSAKTRKLVFTALFAALTTAFTLISIPLATGYFNFGDTIIFYGIYIDGTYLRRDCRSDRGRVGRPYFGIHRLRPIYPYNQSVGRRYSRAIVHNRPKILQSQKIFGTYGGNFNASHKSFGRLRNGAGILPSRRLATLRRPLVGRTCSTSLQHTSRGYFGNSCDYTALPIPPEKNLFVAIFIEMQI